MSKAILEFNLDEPSDQMSFKRASKATDAYLALWAVANEVFRPHRKHGYGKDNPVLDIEEWSEQSHRVVSELEEMFYEILNQYEVHLDELE